MTKLQLKSFWEKVINETHKRSKLGERLKEKEISRLGNLLLYAQILLNKIESGENSAINSLIFTKTMNFYCKQMRKYV